MQLRQLAAELEQAEDDYLLALIEVKRLWLKYLNSHWFQGLQISKLLERIDADLPLRLFDLSSSHTKALATLFASIGQAQRKITSRLDTTYKTAIATDVAVTAIEVATAIGAVKATAVGVAKSAIRKGLTRQAAVRLAQTHALKQLAAAATVYTTVGLGLPPLHASSGLSQQFIFTGLMLMQGLGMLQALRAVGTTQLSHGAGSLADDAVAASSNVSKVTTLFEGCFVAGTMVQTADGPQRIETIAAGTPVVAFDLDTHIWMRHPVVALLTHEYVGDFVAIVAGERVVKTTGNHPFWVLEGAGLADRPNPADVGEHEHGLREGGRWVEARALQVGDILLSRGGPVRVDALTVQHEAIPVFNVEVADLHNYAVGDLGILVHNKALTPRVLQTGGHTIKPATAKALGLMR